MDNSNQPDNQIQQSLLDSVAKMDQALEKFSLAFSTHSSDNPESSSILSTNLQIIIDNQNSANEKLDNLNQLNNLSKLGKLDKLDDLDILKNSLYEKSDHDGKGESFLAAVSKLENSFDSFKGAISELADRFLTIRDISNITDDNSAMQQMASMTNSSVSDVYQAVNVGNRYGANKSESLMFYKEMANINSAISTNKTNSLLNYPELQELDKVAPSQRVLQRGDDKGHNFTALERLENIRKALATLQKVNPDRANIIARKLAHDNVHIYDQLTAPEHDIIDAKSKRVQTHGYQNIFLEEQKNSNLEGNNETNQILSEASNASAKLDNIKNQNNLLAAEKSAGYVINKSNLESDLLKRHGDTIASAKSKIAITNDVNDKIDLLKTVFTAVISFVATIATFKGVLGKGGSGLANIAKSLLKNGSKADKFISKIPEIGAIGKKASGLGKIWNKVSGISAVKKGTGSVIGSIGHTALKISGIFGLTGGVKAVGDELEHVVTKIPHFGNADRMMGKVAAFGARHILPKIAGLFAGPAGWAFDAMSLGYDLYSLYNYMTSKDSKAASPSLKKPILASSKVNQSGNTIAAGVGGTAVGIEAYKAYQGTIGNSQKHSLSSGNDNVQMSKLLANDGQINKVNPSFNKIMNCMTNNNQQYRINIIVQPSSADPMMIAQQVKQQLSLSFPFSNAVQSYKAINC